MGPPHKEQFPLKKAGNYEGGRGVVKGSGGYFPWDRLRAKTLSSGFIVDSIIVGGGTFLLIQNYDVVGHYEVDFIISGARSVPEGLGGSGPPATSNQCISLGF